MHDFFAYIYQQINAPEVNVLGAVFKLFIAMVLGILVGFERKRKGQIAGVRTFALISMGSCMAMLLSIYVPQEYLGLKNGDPGRIAAQVITGIGFLGAGAMIHMRGSVRGLTTAAGIWMTATIGMAVGVGMYLTSVIATLMILFILATFQIYESRVNIGQENRMVKMLVKGIVTDITTYREVFNRHNVHLSTYFLNYDYTADTTEITFNVLAPSHRNYLLMFQDLRIVRPTMSLTLSSQS